MASTRMLLMLALMTALAFSGCLDGDAAQPQPAADADAPIQEAAAEPEPAADPDALPPCKPNANSNNYAVHVQAGDLQVKSHEGGAVTVYQESNGVRGMQYEGECSDPDTKIVDTRSAALPPETL